MSDETQTPSDTQQSVPMETSVSTETPEAVAPESGAAQEQTIETAPTESQPSPETNAESNSAPTKPVVVPPPTPTQNAPVQPAQKDEGFFTVLLRKANEVLFARKRAKLEKIIKLAQKKQVISAREAAVALRISDSTATRYLKQLVKENRLKQVGPPEHARYQTPTS
ncbi:MAG: hypothetical protein CEN90_477 [Parcubacteria group bacterium Licking1014_17]|nr:MAG: hypothetical protein CEN90_477 [Parcubacteria group bacterium Licking1014_17]